MIVVKLKGGLGNQMFQYAMGRNVSLTQNVPLKLDISWFENPGSDTPREYELKHFNILESFASKEEIQRFIKHTRLGKLRIKIIEKIFTEKYQSYITEGKTRLGSSKLQFGKNHYLDGVWGSEKYFSDINGIIKEEFQLRNQSDVVNNRMADFINSVNSISIHVRRGDYVSNHITNQYHGLCTLEYYRRAIAEVAKTTKDPHLFLFSDDPQWVKDNIKINYPKTYVTHNSSEQGHEDLNLMSKCKHNIIANSSLSWWSAWLNSNSDKIIIAPSKWSNNIALDSREYLPKTWITL